MIFNVYYLWHFITRSWSDIHGMSCRVGMLFDHTIRIYRFVFRCKFSITGIRITAKTHSKLRSQVNYIFLLWSIGFLSWRPPRYSRKKKKTGVGAGSNNGIIIQYSDTLGQDQTFSSSSRFFLTAWHVEREQRRWYSASNSSVDHGLGWKQYNSTLLFANCDMRSTWYILMT